MGRKGEGVFVGQAGCFRCQVRARARMVPAGLLTSILSTMDRTMRARLSGEGVSQISCGSHARAAVMHDSRIGRYPCRGRPTGICPAVCADLSQKSVRNSVSAEIMEELAIREGWLADRCTGRKSSRGSLQDAPSAPCYGPPPIAPAGRQRCRSTFHPGSGQRMPNVASGCCALQRKRPREREAALSSRAS